VIKLAEKHGVERIKTMGGSMWQPPEHRSRAVTTQSVWRVLHWNCGIPCTRGFKRRTGVIGSHGDVLRACHRRHHWNAKFIYDLWGETVTWPPDGDARFDREIQVADPSYRLLRATCNFQPRGASG